MAPTLTLHQGDQRAEYVEHPIEMARRALLAAAELESGRWPELLRGTARNLPERGPIMKRED
jgi:hypothetical protein